MPSGRVLDVALKSGFGDLCDRYTTTASAEVVGSWIRRLPHHHMVPCELWDAQTPARRPHRRVRRFRCEVELDTRRGGR